MSGEPQRWICWPDPDKVCLEGGCGYCTPEGSAKGHRKMTLQQVATYADDKGIPLSSYWLYNGMRTRAVR